jgi:O-antigen biosynthesis protein
VEAAAPVPTRDTTAVRNIVLGDLVHERLDEQDLTVDHVHPAITRLQAHRRSLVQVERVDQYGMPPADPDVSIVVPLYRRIDFLEQQLAQFAHDPEIQRADLIYLLDSPELAQETRQLAAQLAQLYCVPFRLATLRHNVGFALANNVGASLARGRLLLLLNSDVLPDAPGWLGEMVAFHNATPRIGALGPKLLYEDDSLQHAGLFFYPESPGRQWNNEHYFKGLHRRLPAANVARPVPAVTAACLMIDAALYRRLGGLSGTYVQGDFEDSDLCLRLAEAGYENWYVPFVELYHLEGQSYPLPLRQLTTRYNRWLHTYLWGQQIEAIMKRREGHAAVQIPSDSTADPYRVNVRQGVSS